MQRGKESDQLLYWKKQYEQVIDENIKLKEKAMNNQNTVQNDYKVELLQQENYQLKQTQLKANKASQDMKDALRLMEDKLAIMRDENRRLSEKRDQPRRPEERPQEEMSLQAPP